MFNTIFGKKIDNTYHWFPVENMSDNKVQTIYLSLTYDECIQHVKDIVSSRFTSDSNDTRSKYWMIFDVDQTLLTDEKYKSQYKSSGDVFRFQYKGDHDPIKPMVDLYNWCVSQGLSMCIITGRNDKLTQITQTNLNKVGILKCHRFYTKKGREDTVMYKARCRKEILDVGGIIIANIGDQENDLLIPDTNGQNVYGYAEYAIKLPSTY